MSTQSTLYYRDGDALRSRSVGVVVLASSVEVPAPPARLEADWQREATDHLGLEPGDVEALPLARARMRWPDYRHCGQAASGWTHALGLGDVLSTCNIALMACRGARYHHDAAHYGGNAFCNLFLSEDQGLDLHFPATGQRIPLVRGTVVVFDTGQPHGVIARHSAGFNAADFPAGQRSLQVFLTWELPIEHTGVARALQVTFDTHPSNTVLPDAPQLQRNGASAHVCPNSGRWLRADAPAISGL